MIGQDQQSSCQDDKSSACTIDNNDNNNQKSNNNNNIPSKNNNKNNIPSKNNNNFNKSSIIRARADSTAVGAQQQRELLTSSSRLTSHMSDGTRNRQIRRQQRNMKIFKTIIVLVCVYIVCCCPFSVITFLDLVSYVEVPKVSQGQSFFYHDLPPNFCAQKM